MGTGQEIPRVRHAKTDHETYLTDLDQVRLLELQTCEHGWGHVSTFGGSELGCVIARTVLVNTLRGHELPRPIEHASFAVAALT